MGSLWALSPVLLAADQRDAQWISSLVLPHKGAGENLCVLMEQSQCFSHVGFPLGVLQRLVSRLGLSSILILCFCMELKNGGKPESCSGGKGCAQ